MDCQVCDGSGSAIDEDCPPTLALCYECAGTGHLTPNKEEIGYYNEQLLFGQAEKPMPPEVA